MDTDRNLRFGVLALRRALVNPEQFAQACAAWYEHRDQPLGDIFVERGVLAPEERHRLEALVDDAGSAGTVDEVAESYGTVEAGTTDYVAGEPRYVPRNGMRYRILRPHAKGGLGEVFVAEDLELHREVALKEIQGRFANETSRRGRFIVEAEITGNLEHPGIVPVYGLGTYPDGRPYYAMKFIRGDTLAAAIDRFHATPGNSFDSLEFRGLLRRFIDVCNAVAYAHSRGVVHRDIKPGNVMLGEFGETLVVDWGLAKAVGNDNNTEPAEMGSLGSQHRTSTGAAETVAGAVVGTPTFMSPEQAAGNVAVTSARSDVYSLGATLFNLLTGQRSVLSENVTEVLARVQRGDVLTPDAIRPDVPKALAAICRMAMALRPDDRYDSALSLASDVEHWLADEPVSAYGEPWTARVGRFARRRRTLVTTAAAVLVVATIGSMISLVVVGGLNHQLDAANVELNGKNTALEAAISGEKEAREVSDKTLAFFVDSLRRPDPSVDGKQLTVYELLGRSIQELDANVTLKPRSRWSLLTAIGLTYTGLGEFQKAIEVHQKALGLAESKLGKYDRDTLASLNNLVLSYRDGGDQSPSIPVLEQVLKAYEAKLGAAHPDTLAIRNNLGTAYRNAGNFAFAISLYESTLRTCEATFGEDHANTLATRSNLAEAYRLFGRFDESIALLKRTIKVQQSKLGNDHPETLGSRSRLANTYEAAGRMDLAIPMFEQTLRAREAKLGNDHPETIHSRYDLGSAYCAAGQLDLATPLLERTLRESEAKLGDGHPTTITARGCLALTYKAAGKLDLAIPLFERTLRDRAATLGDDHPSTLGASAQLAGAYHAGGRLDAAIALYERTLRALEVKLGEEHPDTLATCNNLALTLQNSGKLERAIPLFERTLKACEAKLGGNHPDVANARINLAGAYKAAGKLELAIPLYQRALTDLEAKLVGDHPTVLAARNNLAIAYQSDGMLERAIPLFERTLKACEAKLGDDHPTTLALRNNLALAHKDAGNLSAATPLLERTVKDREAKLGRDHPDTITSRNNLALAYQADGKLEQALPLFETAAAGIERRQFRHEYAGRIIPNTIQAYEEAHCWENAVAWRRKWLPLVKEKAGADSIVFAAYLADLAVNQLHQRKWTDAETTIREALAICQKHHPDAWMTFNAKSMLGDALSRQEKFAEAEPLLLDGYESMKQRESKIPSKGLIRITEALQRLVHLYTAWNKPDEAAKWLAKLPVEARIQEGLERDYAWPLLWGRGPW